MTKTDLLIIGSGIAGLSVAIKFARRFPDRTCLLITKQESAESNTRYAQGGIAVVTDLENDSFESHIKDTLDAGDGLCDPVVVEHVVRQAPARLRELIELGADFDRSPNGALLLGREGGHTANRIIHHHDLTGLNISTALLDQVKAQSNISLLSHHVALDLITEQASASEGSDRTACRGAWVLNVENGRVEKYLSQVTVLATGGAGQLYEATTNPLIATGDGIAMAHRAGARVSNMEFVQFHPTALYDPSASPAFLISEAVRGQGAYLRNAAGERFMFRYHIDGELACRDVVSRAIASEILDGDQPFVYLDCTHLASDVLRDHFPNIFQTCLSKGIDMSTAYIPVAPAAHYLCGGIDVDLNSQTSIQYLYACGECSNTGLHGANRLASNSLLEATVFAHNCYQHIERQMGASAVKDVDVEAPIVSLEIAAPKISNVKVRLQRLMTRYAGIVRSNEGLRHLLGALVELEEEANACRNECSIQWYEVRNMLVCARLIAGQSLSRPENRGGFYNKDITLDQVAG